MVSRLCNTPHPYYDDIEIRRRVRRSEARETSPRAQALSSFFLYFFSFGVAHAPFACQR